jgi:hypothetical protein
MSQKMPNDMRTIPKVSNAENIINLLLDFSIRAMMANLES